MTFSNLPNFSSLKEVSGKGNIQEGADDNAD